MDETPQESLKRIPFFRQHLGRIVVGVILVGMAFSAMTVVLLKGRDLVAMDQCLQNTKYIGMAFHNYLDFYKCLPEILINLNKSRGPSPMLFYPTLNEPH